MMVSVTAGVSSMTGGDPSKTARHTTSVPLCSEVAGMVSVFTTMPLSLVEPVVISGNRPTGDPFTRQVMSVSVD